ncbi:NAD(P)-binding protein [Auriscalpium vulgare]|uniref:NAD(P)-binding protein n=1 Tax=Auriscalpium vulgare TaxID=40419 RepID=A0ACB8SA14_9AGAM|nr:NAD(P)-binding protein [Auriscalpium vulgare]
MGRIASRIHPDKDLLDLHGRVAIVTGATSGIGLFIVLHLVRRGAKVYMVGQSEQQTTEGLQHLKEQDLGPSAGDMVPMHMEFTDPSTVNEAAEQFLKRETRLDILVNNAGKIPSPYQQTEDGVSHSILINHISPFLLTKRLLPLLQQTAHEPDSDVRIVNVSSLAHREACNPRYDSLEAMNSNFEDTKAPDAILYGYTKLANILWTKELQRRFDRESIPITAISLHPGSITTEGTMNQFKRILFLGPLIAWAFSEVLMTAYWGGFTPAYAAAAREIADDRSKYKGQYLVPYGVIEKPSKDALRDDLAGQLWETTEQILTRFKWA